MNRVTKALMSALGIIGGVGGIVASYHVPEITGQFDHARPSVAIAKADLQPGQTARVFVAVDPGIEDTDIVYFPTSLMVRNEGDKLLSNVLLGLAYDKRSHYTAVDVESLMTVSGSRTRDSSAHEHNSGATADYSNFTLKTLNPKDEFTFSEGAQFYPDVSPRSFFEMTLLRSEVSVVLDADNERRRDYTISYRGVRASGCDELVARYRSEYAKYSVIAMRENTRFLPYLWHLLRNAVTTMDYLVCPTYKSKTVDDKRYWIPIGDNGQVLQVSFEPYLWSLLFDTDEAPESLRR